MTPQPADSDEQKRLVELFRYAQIGRCVNSVSHDLNNLLGAIMAYAELVALDPGVAPESRRMVQEIVGAVRKGSALVGNLTDIARKDRADIRIIDPAQLAERAISLIQYNIRSNGAVLETEFPSNAGPIAVDLPKVECALICLLTNALEAVLDAPHKLIRISFHEDGEYIKFILWNSGAPVPEELRDQIFQPFFTTKNRNHVGLGLSFARHIAGQHDGQLSYDPEQGFVLRLPRRNRPAEKLSS